MKFAVKVVLFVAVALALDVGTANPVQASVPAVVGTAGVNPVPIPLPNLPMRSIIVAPIVCPEGQRADWKGKCRDVW